METKEFKMFGYNAEKLSLAYGIFLIAWGLLVSMISGSNSLTSFIPSFIGLPIFLFSLLSILFTNRKKLFMHIAVLLIVLAALGGLDVFRSFPGIFSNFWGDLSKLMLLLTGSFFTYVNVRSFIEVRKNRET